METADRPVAVPHRVLKGPRACTTCARAKSRCIPGPAGQHKCERCHRLRKPCSSQTPAPPRKRKEPKPTRVAELERRLEDLTARIESFQRQAAAVPSPPDSEHYAHPLPTPEDRLPPKSLSGHLPLPAFGRDRWDSPFSHIFPEGSIFEVRPEQPQPAMTGGRAGPGPGPGPEEVSPPVPPPSVAASMGAAGSVGSSPYQQAPSQQHEECPWPQGDEAEALLDEYRTHIGHLFPFAVVPPHLSSAQLREQKPFFWKAVMMEACLFDGPRQITLGNALLRDISEAAFTRPQKNLDLLQGLQLLIAWYHYNLNNFQLTNLLFLARSITIGLSSANLKNLSENAEYPSDCLEKMRAFAGTYYLVTIAFTANKRLDALMNTSYLTTCCRALHRQREYPTDELLVHLIRVQHLAQGISQGLSRRNGIPKDNQTSKLAFIQGLRDRILEFAAALPPHIRANPTLTGHLHVAELLLYENSLPEVSNCPFAARYRGQEPITATPIQAAGPDPERLELLSACVRAVRAFMVDRFAHEVDDYPRFICLSSFDMTYVFVMMLKLVTLQVPGWDVMKARQELRFDDFVARLIEDMEHTARRRRQRTSKNQEQSNSYAGPLVREEGAAAEDPFAKLARKIRNVKDHLLLNGFNSDYASSQVARVYDPPPMTLVDATQDLMQDLGSGLWQDIPPNVPEWNAFPVGDAVDWSAIFNNYIMTESGYAV